MKVLAIVAHPDDAELGIGGSLIKHVIRRDEVRILCLTKGERLVKGRANETYGAAEKMGAKVEILDFPDGGIKLDVDTIGAIEQRVKEFEPRRIYTHSPKDLHQDHKNTAAATLIAGRDTKQVLFFESATIQNKEFAPNFFIDISEFMDDKLELLVCHTSLNGKKFYFNKDIVKGQAYFRGCQARVDYAEGFEVYKYIE